MSIASSPPLPPSLTVAPARRAAAAPPRPASRPRPPPARRWRPAGPRCWSAAGLSPPRRPPWLPGPAGSSEGTPRPSKGWTRRPEPGCRARGGLRPARLQSGSSAARSASPASSPAPAASAPPGPRSHWS